MILPEFIYCVTNASNPAQKSECSRPHTDDDAGLIQCSQLGCKDCFAIFYHRHCKLVWTIGQRILRHRADVEDLVQEVFLAVFLRKSIYDAKRASAKTWIAQLAYFQALARRRGLISRRLTSLDETLYVGEQTGWARLALCNLDRSRLVEEGLEILNSRERRTIELVYFEGYTLNEASNVMKESLANTRNHYYRGMKSLSKFLRFPRAAEGIFRTAEKASADSGASESVLFVEEV
jgi:RNA polymerase sigma-70 factor (ECF subfamily)